MGLALLDIAVWWLALGLIGFITLPITSYICRNLRDHGYSISRPLGLLLLTYISWIISIFAGYSYLSIIFSMGIIAACSLIIYLREGLTLDRNYVLKFEALFLFAFVIFAVIRAYSPDIYWTGGEKLMDMTFINSLLRTTEFPPYDPWMSGIAMYYYYFGYLIVANLIKITGILPSIAFNLATASFFALSLTSAFGIGYNLTEKMRYGVITAFFVAVAGNLAGFFQLMDILFIQRGGINSILSFNYWTGSRVIPYTINEFPFFSFLHGDVHAHMISITFQLLIIVLLLNVMRSGMQGRQYIPSILILGLSIGFLYPLNTWDYPVYLFLAVSVMVTHFFISRGQSLFSASGRDLATLAFAAGTTAALSYLLYLPYHASYKVDKAISIVPSGRTSLIFYLAIYGLFLYLLYSFVILRSRKHNLRPGYFVISLILLSAVVVISIIEFKLFVLDKDVNPGIFEFELLILLIPLLILSVISMIKEKDRSHIFILILIATGVLISLFCEFFYIRDAMSGNPAYVRLNTVFKLYLQNWVLWGVAAGAILSRFENYFTQKRAWGIAAAVLIVMVSIYPVFATIGKSGAFGGEPTLDGEAYVKRQHPQDYAAILWFRNITGQPVVLQARADLYTWNTSVTAFTGLPTVIGWAGHELNWRFPYRKDIDERWFDANKMYTSSNLEEVDALLKKYNVSYIYFGEVEAKIYSPQLFDSHPERFERVFEYGDVVVYKVIS
ncbi:Chlor Arch YYY domain [Candidatus Methanoperedens nitroreducens]|uniref:Chlor Arch YYY domain n=1 Tax=Candidatus Methanoperedens nitratireducens TaxID=1392998 RepID=A0A062V7Q7_9EURY|nr:DUF2298 domain-containing protein [Candidatus Methanoperedens nitroreducens]KCZ71804.1 Chlor Arch YYY domain [Candidatus Methanoperedens nitroreducens]MDJ1422221.1 DUF2298 domain-containing protein [Candidatus Methanoperedens sp.]